MQLPGRCARGNREVQAIDEPGTPQRRESQDGRLRLPRSSFALQNQQRTIERSRRHGALRRSRLAVVEQRSDIRRGGVLAPAEPAEALPPDHLGRDATGSLDVVRDGIGLVLEGGFIRSELVGESHGPGEQMRQRGRIRQRRSGLERGGEPRTAPLVQQSGDRPRVVAGERLPQLWGAAPGAGGSPRRATMMREHRVDQGNEAVAPFIHHAVEPQELAHVRLIATEQRLGKVPRAPGTTTGRPVRPPHLELEARVELAEVVQKGEEGQAGGRRVAEVSLARRAGEPRP